MARTPSPGGSRRPWRLHFPGRPTMGANAFAGMPAGVPKAGDVERHLCAISELVIADAGSAGSGNVDFAI